jgi:hypothetical protein
VAVPYQGTGLTEGRRYFVVEIFFPYASITGFDRLLPGMLPEVLYDRTIF